MKKSLAILALALLATPALAQDAPSPAQEIGADWQAYMRTQSYVARGIKAILDENAGLRAEIARRDAEAAKKAAEQKPSSD